MNHRPAPSIPAHNGFDAIAGVLDKINFVCLLVVIYLAVIPYGSVDAWWGSLFECSVFGLTGLWLIQVVLRREWRIDELFLLVPLVLITVYAFLQAVPLPAAWFTNGTGRFAQHTLSVDRYQTLMTARKCLALTLFLGLLLLHTTTSRRLRWLIRAVIGVGLGSAIFGIARQLVQSPESTSGFVLPFLFPGMGYGEFISSNVFAFLMEMVFPLLLALICAGGITRNRIPVYLAAAVVVWTALVLSNSRGGILSLIIASVFVLSVSFAWRSARRISEGGGSGGWIAWLAASRVMRVIMVGLMLGILVVGVAWMGGEQLTTKMTAQTSFQDVNDGTTRRQIWQGTLKLIRARPITGIGFGAFFLAYPQFQIGSGRIRVEQAHNDYLDLVANGGVVALGLAIWFVVMIIGRARTALGSHDAYRRAAALGAVAGMLGVASHSVVDFGLQVTGIAVVLGCLVTIATAGDKVNAPLVGSRHLSADSRSRLSNSTPMSPMPRVQ